jgi:RNA polymerase sigma-70 factor (ECF subfamily)
MASSDPSPDPDLGSTGLLGRAVAGDDTAYERLFALAAPRLRLYLSARMGAALRAVADPEDALQETWIEAHRALARFEPRGTGSFLRWLCRIAENVLRGMADRKDARRRTPPGSALPFAVAEGRLDSATGAATAAGRGEERARVGEALTALPEDERQTIVLRFFAGMTIDEIAALTGDAPTTVRRRLGRAAVGLGALLEGAP